MIATLVLDANAFIGGSYAHLAESFVTTQDVLNEIKDKSSKTSLDADLQSKAIKVRQPTSDAIVKVTAFAKATGDLSVLSQTDLRLCALLLTVEVEANGFHRVRPSLGKLSPYEQEREALREQRRARRKEKAKQRPKPEPVPEEKKTEAPLTEEDVQEEVEAPEEDSDGGEWITPENIAAVKAAARSTPVNDTAEEQADLISAAILTSDFAMQNVMMQMGLNVVGTNGLKIKDIKTWVLRCHACFKLCKKPMEKFCPSCGNPTLIRTSITYLPKPTAEHPQGYILHLKRNFQYNNRGTIFSLPTPLSTSGASKKSGNDIILRADQKEWLRGKNSYEIVKRKEEKRAAREAERGGGPDVDWMPAMLLGEKGRKQQKGGRLGKDGLPVIGYGRKNPNQVGRKQA